MRRVRSTGILFQGIHALLLFYRDKDPVEEEHGHTVSRDTRSPPLLPGPCRGIQARARSIRCQESGRRQGGWQRRQDPRDRCSAGAQIVKVSPAKRRTTWDGNEMILINRFSMTSFLQKSYFYHFLSIHLLISVHILCVL